MDSRNSYSGSGYTPSYGGSSNTPGYNDYGMPTEQPVSVGNWIGSLILCCIPVVNIIMLIVWAASEPNRSKKNWAIAQLIIMVVAIVLSIVIGVILGAAVASSLRNFY